MALSYKARRRWSLVILLIWMPIYVILAVDLYERHPAPAYFGGIVDLLFSRDRMGHSL